jgi:hypothetical protein
MEQDCGYAYRLQMPEDPALSLIVIPKRMKSLSAKAMPWYLVNPAEP